MQRAYWKLPRKVKSALAMPVVAGTALSNSRNKGHGLSRIADREGRVRTLAALLHRLPEGVAQDSVLLYRRFLICRVLGICTPRSDLPASFGKSVRHAE